MEPLGLGDLPEGALVLIDAAPLIYFLEGHAIFAPRFRPLFEAHVAGRLRFAVTTITIAEVPTDPLQASDEALSRRYRAILESWHPVALDLEIAESAARLRASLRLKLADAVQAASALARRIHTEGRLCGDRHRLSAFPHAPWRRNDVPLLLREPRARFGVEERRDRQGL